METILLRGSIPSCYPHWDVIFVYCLPGCDKASILLSHVHSICQHKEVGVGRLAQSAFEGCDCETRKDNFSTVCPSTWVIKLGVRFQYIAKYQVFHTSNTYINKKGTLLVSHLKG